MKITRRDFIPLAGVGALAGYAGWQSRTTPTAGIPQSAAVAIVKAASYSHDLASRMVEGIRECGLNVRGKKILLKPNLVEYIPGT